MADSSVTKLLGAGLADAITAMVRRLLDTESADFGIGTVTAVNPGGITGTVAVDTGSGTAIPMRHNPLYTPSVSDKVRWSRSRAGDWFADYEL